MIAPLSLLHSRTIARPSSGVRGACLRLPALLLGVALALGLFVPRASAQLPSHLVRRRVVDVRVVGESSGATGARDVGIPLGVPLTRLLLRSTVERMLASGRWADVQIDAIGRGDDVVLIVRLRPRIVITRVDVIGNETLTDDEVRNTLGLGAEGELEDPALEPLARLVIQAYVERGYGDADVNVRLRDTDDPSRKVLRVRVAEGEPVRVAEYVYVEDTPPPDFDLPDAVGLGEGDVLDQTRLREGQREAARALRRLGYLESRLGALELRRAGGRTELVVSLHLGPRYVIRIVGHEPLERTTVEEALHLEEQRLTRRTLAALKGHVVTLLQRHGYHRADADIVRYAGEGPDTAVLEIQIRTGRQLHVVGMSFPGASHYGSDYLHEQVVSVLEEDLPDTRLFAAVDTDTVDRLGLGGRAVRSGREVPRPLEVDPGRVYYAPLYEQAVEHLAEVYQAAGFLSARVGAPSLRSVGPDRAVVVMPVFEGPRTLLFGVRVSGNDVVGDRELLQAAELVRGAPFSYLGLEEAITRMTHLYEERGHIYARIEPSVRFSEDRERAEVVLTVVERFEVHFGEISIEGNTRTDAGLIRDALLFSPGDLFRPSLVRSSEEALMALGVFGAVNITPRDEELAERVKAINIVVRERQPQYVDFQLGISTGQGARGSFEYGYRNLGGYALGLTLRAQLGFQFIFQDQELSDNISGLSIQDRLERRITVTLTLPHVAGIDNVRSTLDLVHLRDNQRAFGLDKNGAVLSFNWRPLRGLSFTLSGEVEHNAVQLLGDLTSIEQILEEEMGNPQITRLLRVPNGESAFVSSRLSGALDQRDSPFVPTQGWFTSAAVEWVHSLPITAEDDPDYFYSHFLKLSATLNGYIPIGDVVIAGQIRAGGVVPLESESLTSPNRQFFLGGVDSLRGFNQDQLQPQDIAALQLRDPRARTATVLQGGNFFYLVRVELRFPIFGSFEGGIFADLGNHWADPKLISFDEDFIRPTAGLGIRIATPVGPLALDYGFNLLRREELNEPFGAFHFSIGVF